MSQMTLIRVHCLGNGMRGGGFEWVQNVLVQDSQFNGNGWRG